MNRILLICAKEKTAQTLKTLLAGILPVETVWAGRLRQARDQLAQTVFSLVILNLPFPEDGVEAFIQDLSRSTSSGVLLLCPSETTQEALARWLPAGVLVMPKPLSQPLFVQSVHLGLSTSARLSQLLAENQRLHSKLEELRIVSRAKAVLIEYLKLSEPQAHRYIEKQAMDLGLTRHQVAQNILKTYES